MTASVTVQFPATERPTASIIVVATGDAPHLLECLHSVAMNVRTAAYEVIVVLNGAESDVTTMMARQVEGAHVTPSRVNRGFAGGCNLGASTATGTYLVLLNDDTQVEPGWLENLMAAAERRPLIGAVGSRLLHQDGSLQEAGQVVWSDGSTSCVGRNAPPSAHAYEWARRVDYCSGSSLLIRRATWEGFGRSRRDLLSPPTTRTSTCVCASPKRARKSGTSRHLECGTSNRRAARRCTRRFSSSGIGRGWLLDGEGSWPTVYPLNPNRRRRYPGL